MTVPALPLNNGHSIPRIGLGTWPMNDDQAESIVAAAIALGYRHIDTAYRYENETGVGRAIRASGVPRGDLFVTTKLDGEFQGEDRAIAGLDESLRHLGLDYVDLLLIHWPLPARDLYVSTWKTFERLMAEGKTKSIGVSNFKPAHIDRLIAETGTTPAVNQIQANPYFTRDGQRAYDAEHGIVTVAFSPLGAGRGLAQNPLFEQIGAAHGKTPGQVILRWHIQSGMVAIPRTTNPGRLKDNIDVFEFALSDEEMAEIATLSRGPDAGVDSDTMGH